MHRFLLPTFILGTLASWPAFAQETTVPGTDVRFQAAIQRGQQELRLTGVALRTKLIVKVYAIASYVPKDVKLNSPEELAGADVMKMLHLVLQREVAGREMAAAVSESVRANYPAPLFDQELRQITDFMSNLVLQKGDQVYLTHMPGAGLQVEIAGKGNLRVSTPAFSRAIWDIYLGVNNLGPKIKQGLVAWL